MAGPRAVGAMLAELERLRAQGAYRAGLWLSAIGVLAAAATTVHKHFQARTEVRSGSAGSVASLMLEHVEIEDPRFDRAFRVNSSDQIEARYLLTPGFCERLLALRKHFESVDAVFHDSCIVLALGADYDFLEPDVNHPIGEAQFNEMVRELEEIVAFVEHLKLNTRIWSKKPGAQAQARA